jgi:hypothetical protein
MGKVFAFIGAGVLFLLGLGAACYGGLLVLGSTSSSGSGNWLGFGIGFLCLGFIFFAAGAGMIFLGMRGQKTEVIQNVTMKMDLDLPGQTKVEQMKCQSCGGVITSADIKIMAGAPVVTCPYCQSTYQLTEEPKW